ncbi:MAG: hypothetical protein Q4B36_07525 [Tissierellia bacterium]|nr:hypothetical protein [Tissierellia bacterium]
MKKLNRRYILAVIVVLLFTIIDYKRTGSSWYLKSSVIILCLLYPIAYFVEKKIHDNKIKTK